MMESQQNDSHVRRRPGMYIGWADGRGIRYLVHELIANAINEVRAGFGSCIALELLPKGGFRVSDNGRGIPIESGDGGKILEYLMGPYQFRSSASRTAFPVAYSLQGGLKVVNALSARVVAEVRRGGRLWRQEFGQGRALTRLKSVEPTKETGTSIAFWPDSTILNDKPIASFDDHAEHLRQGAALNKGIEITLVDSRSEPSQSVTCCYPNGLSDYLAILRQDEIAVHPTIFCFASRTPDREIEVALQWTKDSDNCLIRSYVNSSLLANDGTHVAGALAGVVRILNGLGRFSSPVDEAAVRHGLKMLVAVNVKEIQYWNATHSRLANPELEPFVADALSEHFQQFLVEHPQEAEAIVRQVKNMPSMTLRSGKTDGI